MSYNTHTYSITWCLRNEKHCQYSSKHTIDLELTRNLQNFETCLSHVGIVHPLQYTVRVRAIY